MSVGHSSNQAVNTSSIEVVQVSDQWHPDYKNLVLQAVRFLALKYTKEQGHIQSFEIDKNLVVRIGKFREDSPNDLLEGLQFWGDGEVKLGVWSYIPEMKYYDLSFGVYQAAWHSNFACGVWCYNKRSANENVPAFSMREGIASGRSWGALEGFRAILPSSSGRGALLTQGRFTHASGLVEDGRWAYERQARNSVLLEGKKTFPNGTVEEGTWAFNSNLGEMVLDQGKRTHPKGKVEDGHWAYVPQLRQMRLNFGQVTHALGVTENGRFKYEPEMNDMALTQGQSEFVGLSYKGTFALEPEAEVNKPFLQKGTQTERSGTKHEGTWAYIPELKRMHLVDGRVKNEQGSVLMDGTWAYSSTAKGMQFTPRPKDAPPRLPLPEPVLWKPKPPMAHKGWVPSEAFKAAFKSGWLTAKNLRFKDDWTVKVMRGSCPKGAGGEKAKQNWRKFEAPLVAATRAEAQLEIARNLLNHPSKKSLDEIASLTALPPWQVHVLRAELAAPSVADIEFKPPRATIEVRSADFS